MRSTSASPLGAQGALWGLSSHAMLSGAFDVRPSKKEAWAARLGVNWKILDRGDQKKLDECLARRRRLCAAREDRGGRATRSRKGSEGQYHQQGFKQRAGQAHVAPPAEGGSSRQQHANGKGSKGAEWLATCADAAGSELVDSPKASRAWCRAAKSQAHASPRAAVSCRATTAYRQRARAAVRRHGLRNGQ